MPSPKEIIAIITAKRRNKTVLREKKVLMWPYRTPMHAWCLELGNGTMSLLSFVFCTGYSSFISFCTVFISSPWLFLWTFLHLHSRFFVWWPTLSIPVTRTTTYNYGIFNYCDPRQWNSLPNHILYQPIIESFKCALKTSVLRASLLTSINIPASSCDYSQWPSSPARLSRQI